MDNSKLIILRGVLLSLAVQAGCLAALHALFLYVHTEGS